ncbi:putative DNA binding domain-containing protein [Candidatus Dependentiae bacterium]|nr:putative DNA binding domain-containing protein [Candidatus Dependentiae bacterium]
MKYPEKESSILEFKREIPKNNQIVKTVIGFCNQNGGKILIGVEDDGTLRGLSESALEEALEYIEKHIFETTNPPIIPLIFTQTIEGMTILIIQVARGMNKPYYLKSEGLERGVYIRLGRSNLRATADIIEELRWGARGRSFDTMPVYHAQIQDLHEEKIKNFFKTRRGSKFIPADFNEALAAYNLTVTEHASVYPTVAGILLFGKNPEALFSESMIICSRFIGIEGREALATEDCTGTLFEQFHQAYEFILKNLSYSFSIKGLKRKDVLEVPEVALREALINALIHRNYHIKAPIKVAIYDNRIEIFSPGSFPGPLTPKNLKMGLTYIRNAAVVKVFREAGYSEKLGTGFITIFSSYEAQGLREPEIIEGENFIKYILPRASQVRKDIKSPQSDVHRILDLFETATELSVGEILTALHMPRSTVGKRLAALVKEGVLRKHGIGSGTRYSKTEL